MSCLRHCITNGKLRILVKKPSPALQAPGHCHQLGLAYGHETWVYPTNTLSASVAFLLLPDTNLFPQAGIIHYSQFIYITPFVKITIEAPISLYPNMVAFFHFSS